ncbi:prephenate dehydrogenase/arogenate dehydrogenase family protein [Ruegeria sp. 2205SS24-7]|uniref:prephenate dehydrogenase/arogenate dehydrogenase family protein n=1 Tax=Ruegeria discodermiae TaxID=3064389 RepID=UPI00274292D9|nr:prephenate dehydrogenase/arogenate dehydrogenase family protein [Ruegeria sp. 2205SS24-7]MDP5216867.1 prephenate dehydrogenase/arogenate dehydrogenase family protein [Ruegeria sp. 2205SS24-7]
MNTQTRATKPETVGIIGFGAFGRLIAEHLRPYFKLFAYDPSPDLDPIASKYGVKLTSIEGAARCDVVVIASPVSSFENVLTSIANACRPGTLVVDVGSVKVLTAQMMNRVLPDNVEIIATHPLFGPQSARDGIRGLKIAICPIRGQRHLRLASFLRKALCLRVIVTSPDEHDRDAAMVQGLTHLIAKVLSSMGPLPSRITTRSFDLLTESIAMVQNDAPEVFDAIENANPYAEDVRKRFFRLAEDLSRELDQSSAY